MGAGGDGRRARRARPTDGGQSLTMDALFYRRGTVPIGVHSALAIWMAAGICIEADLEQSAARDQGEMAETMPAGIGRLSLKIFV